MGVTFTTASGTSNEIPVESYKWNVQSTGASVPSLADFELVLDPGAAEPDVWGVMASQVSFSQVVLHIRNADGAEYQTYKLGNASISSFETASPGGVGDKIALRFDQIEEDYAPGSSGGPLGTPVTVTYDRTNNTGGATSNFPAAAPPDLPMRLSFGASGVAAIPVDSYSWSAVGDFQVVLDPDFEEPWLWGVMVSNQTYSQVFLRVRHVDSDGNLTDLLTYTLSDSAISSFATSSPGGTQDTISLRFNKVEEDDVPVLPNGTFGTPVTVTYDKTTSIGGASDIAAPPPASTPQMGVTFTTANGTSNEIPVKSYSWLGNNDDGSTPSFLYFVLELDPGIAEPDLWGVAVSNVPFSQIVLHIRNATGQEYQTYKLGNAAIGIFDTASPGGSGDSIALRFDQIEEDYARVKPDGTLGTPVTVSYDKTNNTGGASSFFPTNQHDLPMGLSFQSSGESEIPVDSYSWRSETVGGSVPNVFDFEMVVDPGVLEPLLWGVMVGNQTSSQVFLQVRHVDGNGNLTDILTYTLSDAVVSSFFTASPGGAQDTIDLRFNKIEEEDVPINSGAPPTSVTYDKLTNTGGASAIVAPPPASTPQMGVTFTTPNGTSNEIPVESYEWNGELDDASLPDFGPLQLVLDPGTAEPDVWGVTVSHVTFSRVVLHLRNSSGTEYQTYTLSNAVPVLYTTSSPGGVDDEILLLFSKIEEDSSPVLPDGTLGAPVKVTYDLTTNIGGARAINGPGLITTTAISAPFNVNNLIPTIASLSPTAVQEGSTDTTVTTTGSHFVSGATLRLNGVSLATTFIDSSHVRVIVPASFFREETTISVTVTNPLSTGPSNALALTVFDAPLTATGVTVSPTAGAPFSGVVAHFTDANPLGALADYSALITWGDGNSSTGVVRVNASGGFDVLGSNTYAAAGTYTLSVKINDVGGSSITARSTAKTSSLGIGVQKGQSADIGFWANPQGQSLIDAFNGSARSTALGDWLATTVPNIYGPTAGADNLTGKTNSQVAAMYLTLFHRRGPKLNASVLATALDLYATTRSLGGTVAKAYGFTVTDAGLGASSVNVGSNGAAFDVRDKTTLNVYEILTATNKQAINGVLYNRNNLLRHEALNVLGGIDASGGI